MIVLVETNSGTKKCFIRDKIFMEVNESNKKIPNGTIRTANIQNVFWIKNSKVEKIPTADWLKLMEDRD